MKTVIGCFVLLGILAFQNAQTNDTPHCVQLSASHLHYLDSTGKNQLQQIWKSDTIHILHVGDSHIEMGSFSEGILATLNEYGYPFEEGWTFPTFSKNATWKNPKLKRLLVEQSIRFEHSENGITGRYLTPHQLTNRTIHFKKPIQNLELLLGNSQNSTFVTKRIIAMKKKVHLNEDTRNATKLYAIKTTSANYTYSNFGISGARWSHYENDSLILDQLNQMSFQILIFTLGTNDSYASDYSDSVFKKRLALIQTIKNRFPKSMCILMTAPDTFYKQQKPPHLNTINTQIHAFCKENAIACWDWHAVMGGDGSMNCWENSMYKYGDYLHFSKESYHLFGQLFAKAILQYKSN